MIEIMNITQVCLNFQKPLVNFSLNDWEIENIVLQKNFISHSRTLHIFILISYIYFDVCLFKIRK